MSKPDPLNVYVSAGSRGLAFDIAHRLVRDGANVALSSRSADNLKEAKEALLNDNPATEVITLTGDLSSADGQEHILDALDDRDFAPDVFVCSAGQPPDVRVDSISREQWNHDVEMILGQAVFAARRFAPAMAKQGYGRFFFVSSTYAKVPDETFITSSIPRAGLFALSRAITAQYAARGVASFPLCLGFVDTPLLRNMAIGRDADAPDPATSSPEEAWQSQFAKWAEDIPAQRIGSPQELAGLVAFLTLPAAGYLSGTVMSFSGGLDNTLF